MAKIILPCEECIVTTMCRDACDELVSFMINNTVPVEATPNSYCVGHCLRSGNVLIEGKHIRKTSGGSICCSFKEIYDG